jgi:hypothetical protein
VFAASEVASLPKEQQREIVAKGEDEIVKTANRIRRERKNERLGPIIAPILTEYQRKAISDAVASLRVVRADLAFEGIDDFADDIDRLIERMTNAAEKATAA